MSETLHSSPQHVRFVPWIRELPLSFGMPALSRFARTQSAVVVKLAGLEELGWSVPTYICRVITDSAEELEVQVTEAAKKQWMELPLMVAFNMTIPGSALKTRTSGEKRRGVGTWMTESLEFRGCIS